MANDLVALEKQFEIALPTYGDVLQGRMDPHRLVRSVIVSCEKTPKLLLCTRQSLMNAAMSAAVLALEVDGVTGQGFIIPYNIKGELTAQFQTGYKGMNTLGARSGYSITAGTVREDDVEWDYREGSGGFVHHKRKLGNAGRIIAFWAIAESRTLPPLISILGIDEVMAIKEKSPARNKSDSPWNDPKIGFPAMGEKSARRRLNRSMPLNALSIDFHRAALIDEAVDERGKTAYLRPDGALMIEGNQSPISPRQSDDRTPNIEDLKGPRPDAEYAHIMAEGLEAAEGGSDVVKAWWARLSPRQQTALEKWKDVTLKPKAEAADKGDAI